MTRASDLKAFATWLTRRGRSQGTVDLYVRDVALAYGDGDDPLPILLLRRLAPKTKRHLMAALRAWATFKADGELLKSLSDMKLPPPARKLTKQPLTTEEWSAFSDAVNKADDMDPVRRAVLGLMTDRGLRCGDVLRLERRVIRQGVTSGTLTFEAKGGRWLNYAAAPITHWLEALLAIKGRWERVEDIVCPDSPPERRRKSAWTVISRALHAVAVRAGLDPAALYTHRLRRTYAVHFLQEMAGDPEALQKLQKQMQWASPSTLFEYTDFIHADELAAVDERMRKRRNKKERDDDE